MGSAVKSTRRYTSPFTTSNNKTEFKAFRRKPHAEILFIVEDGKNKPVFVLSLVEQSFCVLVQNSKTSFNSSKKSALYVNWYKNCGQKATMQITHTHKLKLPFIWDKNYVVSSQKSFGGQGHFILFCNLHNTTSTYIPTSFFYIYTIFTKV